MLKQLFTSVSVNSVRIFTSTLRVSVNILALFTSTSVNNCILFVLEQWDRLNDPKIWKDAATQMFFTLGIGFGTLITFASYMPKNNQCMKDTYTVVFVNCGTSIFSGFVVFTILGYRELKTGIKAADVSFFEFFIRPTI